MAVLDGDLVVLVGGCVLGVSAEDGGAGAVEDDLLFVGAGVNEYSYGFRA